MHFMRQNSGSGAGSGDTVSIGPCLDSAGAEYTGLVIGDLTITKNGTSAAMAANATLTHTSNGHYDLVMIGNNADTLGKLSIRCNKSTYQIPTKHYIVLPASVYDAIVANATNGTGGLIAATGTVSAAAGYVGSTGAAVNGTNANTLSSHDPGTTIGTSTLTQTQVTGGAYNIQSSSCVLGDARIANLDATVSSRAPSATALSTAQWTNARAGYLNNINNANLASVPTFPTNFSTMSIDGSGNVSVDVPTVQSGLVTVTQFSGKMAGLVLAGDSIDTVIGDTGNTTTTLHLPDMLQFPDDAINDCIIVVKDFSVGTRVIRRITDWVQSTRVATLDSALPFTPENNVDFYWVLSLKDMGVRQTGDSYARIGANGASLSAIPWNASWDAEVQSEVSDELTARGYSSTRAGYLDNLSAGAVAQASALSAVASNVTSILADTTSIQTDTNDIQSTLGSLLTTALTESYRADGATGSVAQLLYEIMGHHNEANNVGVTKTIKKINGSTTAFTCTYDDATTPTSVTRST